MVEISVEGRAHGRVYSGVTAACALLITLLIFLFHVQFTKNNYLFNDSADYRRAASAPFLKMYLNTDSASPVRLFQLRENPAFRAHPWDYLYFRDDNAALRHFHVPFSFYAVHVVSLISSADENQRLLSSAVTAVTCGVVVVGLSVFEVPLAIAIMLALIAGVQSRYTEVSVSPSPHGWYMLFAVLFLFTFASYLNNRRFRTLAISAVFLGFAFATLEFSLELICSIGLALAFLWLMNRSALGNLKTLFGALGKALLIFFITTFILWPGGWLRGGYLESYGILGAAFLFKNKVFIGDRLTIGGLYDRFFAGHEALLVLTAFFLIASAVLGVHRKLSTVTVIFMSYTLVSIVLGAADHFQHDTYISEALLFLLITVALLLKDILAGMVAGKRQLAVAIAVVVLAIVGAQEWSARLPARLYAPWLKPVLVGVSRDVPAGSTILVNDYWEAYYTYLSKYDYEPTVSISDLTPQSAARTRGVHFFLLTSDAPRIPQTKLLESFPTNIPGKSVKLYKEAR